MAGWFVLAMLMSAAIFAGLLGSELAHRIALDRPNARSLHTGAIPRVGGLGVMGASLMLTPFAPAGQWLAPAALLSLLSLWDDRHSVSPGLRLGIQLFVIAAWVFGAQAMPLGLGLLVCLGIAWLTNLYNFMDGSDGLAGAMAVIGFAALGIAASGQDFAALAWILSGAALGFLFFNAPPARLFMGDCGSIPLGLIAGLLSVEGGRRGVWPAWFPLLVFSAFIVDASLTLLLRVLRGARVWEAHREHAYQRLVLAGWSKRQVLLCYTTLMLVTTVSALAALRLASGGQHAILTLWCVIYLILAGWVLHKYRLPPTARIP